METSFFFSSLSAPLCSALRDKCYYLISYYKSSAGPFIQSVTFRESSDIRGGAAVLVYGGFSSGCRRGGMETGAELL